MAALLEICPLVVATFTNLASSLSENGIGKIRRWRGAFGNFSFTIWLQVIPSHKSYSFQSFQDLWAKDNSIEENRTHAGTNASSSTQDATSHKNYGSYFFSFKAPERLKKEGSDWIFRSHWSFDMFSTVIIGSQSTLLQNEIYLKLHL